MKLNRYIIISFLYLVTILILFLINPWIAEIINIILTLPWSIFEENIISNLGLNFSPIADNIPYRRLIHFTYSTICFLLNIVIIRKLLYFFKYLKG